jgi:hypothetical protein
MTCRNQSDWDTAADLPDDLPDAVCHDCGCHYSRELAKLLDGICHCTGLLIPDNGDAQ